MNVLPGKPKILILASWYPKNETDPGGGFILEQARALEKAGCEVRVVDCSIRIPFIPHYFLNQMTYLKIKNKLIPENWSPDVIHAHVAFPAGDIGLKLKDIFKCKTVLTEHCGPIELLDQYYRNPSELNSLYSKYDKVIAVSQFQCDGISGRAPSARTQIIGNIVGDIFFETPLLAPSNRHSLALISRLDEPKGIPELLEALKILDETTPFSITLNIVGVGMFKAGFSNFKNIIPVFWGTGRLQPVIDSLQQSSFLLLPSRHETFSLVAAEAIAMGRRVLGFECGGPGDFIKTRMQGVLLPQRSPEDLARLILKELNDIDSITTSTMERMRASIKEKYSSDKIAHELLSKAYEITDNP